MQDHPASWYRDALDAMSDLVLIKGPGSRLQWANKAFLDYYGMTEEELFGIIDGPQADPDDTLQYVRDDKLVFDTGRHLNVQSEEITDGIGNSRKFHTLKSPIYEDNNVVRSIGVSRPLVSDDTLAPDHLAAKSLSNPFRQIVGAFPLPLLLLDTRFTIVAYSPEWAENFGVIEADLETSISELGGDLSQLEELVMLAFEHHRSQASLLEIDDRFYDITAMTWFYDDDNVGGVLVVASDSTNRFRREQDLKSINDDLEHFVHLAAHDLREPSRRQLLLTDLIMEDFGEQVSPGLRKHLGQLQDQARNVLDLVTAFRFLTNIRGPEAKTERFELSQIVNKLITEYFSEIPDDQIQIELPASIVGHRQLVETLFRNLLENVSKYSSENMSLSIRTCAEHDETVFAVENTWAGSRDLHHNFLQPFVRGQTTSKGYGIGLSICKRIVVIHGGRLWLDPTPTTFCVRFTLGQPL